MRDGRRDVEVFASRDRKLRRYAAGPGTWGCRGMEIWRYAAGPEMWRCRGMEIWRCAAGVGTCRRYRGLELGSSGAALEACIRGGVCLKRSGAQEALLWAWGHRGMEIGRHAAGLGTFPQKRPGDALQACCLYLFASRAPEL